MDTPHADEPLFEVPLGPEEGVGAPRAKLDKTFRAYHPGQMYLLPPSIDDWVPEATCGGSSPSLSTKCSISSRSSPPTQRCGATPYDPRLMVKLLVYGYIIRVRSSRAIERSVATRCRSGSWRQSNA